MGKATGKTAIITGGGTGLGRALTTLLAKEGYSVAVIARSEEPLRDVCAEVVEQGGRAFYRSCDITDAEALRVSVHELVGELDGRLDLMIINAGMIGFSKQERLPSEKMRQVLQTNIMGSVASLHAVIPQMAQQGFGQIVGISSLGAFFRWPVGGLSYYYTSKRCMSLLLGTYRRHLRVHGISVSIMHPGWIETAMVPKAESGKMSEYLDTPESAARKIMNGVEAKKDLIFPWPLFIQIQRRHLFLFFRTLLQKGLRMGKRSA